MTQGRDDDSRISAVDVTTKESKGGMGLYSVQFSPDVRWVAFYSRSKDSVERLFVAPFANGKPIPPSAWIPVTDGRASDNKPRWSPDGNLIYFTSDREGGESIWAQRLDPSTKNPRDEPFLVEQLRRGL